MKKISFFIFYCIVVEILYRRLLYINMNIQSYFFLKNESVATFFSRNHLVLFFKHKKIESGYELSVTIANPIKSVFSYNLYI